MDFEAWGASLEALAADYTAFCSELSINASIDASIDASMQDLSAKCDAFEQATRRLQASVGAAQTSQDRTRAQKNMSQTFSENVKVIERRMLKSLAQALSHMDSAMGAALRVGAAQHVGAQRADAFFDAPHGAVATNLFMGTLVCGSSTLLGQMATVGLGGTPDTVQDLLDDTETLGQYHFTQAMGFMPLAARSAAHSAAGALDLTLPGAEYATIYNISTLIGNTQPALQGVSTVAGLSHPIVVALRTISTAPLPERAAHAPPPAIAHGPVMVTTDRRTAYPLAAGAGAWAPLAGASPRAALYAQLCRPEVVETADPPEDEVEISASIVVETLVRCWRRTPPDTGEAYLELVMAPPAPAGFIGQAAAALIEDTLRPLLRAIAARPAAPRAAERELRLTQAVRVADLAADLGRRLRREFRPAGSHFASEFRRLAERVAATPVFGISPGRKVQALMYAKLAG